MHTQDACKHNQHQTDDLAHLILSKMNTEYCTKSIVYIFKVTFYPTLNANNGNNITRIEKNL